MSVWAIIQEFNKNYFFSVTKKKLQYNFIEFLVIILKYKVKVTQLIFIYFTDSN